MEAIAIKAGAKLVHVPYPSSPAAVTSVIRNDTQMGCLPAISVTPHTRSGAVKILAVSTARRSAFLPNVPTLKESGIDVEADAWMGLIAPGSTPRPVVDAINKDVVAIVNLPGVRSKLATQLMEPVGSSPEEFRARIEGEIARWKPVIEAADVKVN
jgi:tripartite-type tricarboxylate transporter receptor subunit TctC